MEYKHDGCEASLKVPVIFRLSITANLAPPAWTMSSKDVCAVHRIYYSTANTPSATFPSNVVIIM